MLFKDIIERLKDYCKKNDCIGGKNYLVKQVNWYRGNKSNLAVLSALCIASCYLKGFENNGVESENEGKKGFALCILKNNVHKFNSREISDACNDCGIVELCPSFYEKLKKLEEWYNE